MQTTNIFFEKRNDLFKTSSLLVFFGFSIITYAIYFSGHIFFPTQNTFQWITRNTIAATGIVLLIVGSRYLLTKNNFHKNALGITFSKKTMFHFLLGSFIAIIFIVTMGSILWLFVPFHFEQGALSGLDVSKDALNYFTGNFYEELVFRGYPLILISQIIGWRKAVWVMALPFGLFHLPGMGFGIEAWKMVVTTTASSFIFCYSFILTGTLWTAIALHVTANLLLHSVTGLDGVGRSLYNPVFDADWPTNFNAGFITFLFTTIIISGLLFYFIKIRHRNIEVQKLKSF